MYLFFGIMMMLDRSHVYYVLESIIVEVAYVSTRYTQHALIEHSIGTYILNVQKYRKLAHFFASTEKVVAVLTFAQYNLFKYMFCFRFCFLQCQQTYPSITVPTKMAKRNTPGQHLADSKYLRWKRHSNKPNIWLVQNERSSRTH